MLRFNMREKYSVDGHDKGQNVACNRLGKPYFKPSQLTEMPLALS